jgi:DNA invertase Pin-like site-specific DNA recombinase
MRAAIYTRISKDREGTRAGVERQLADCETLAERRKWTIVDMYEDDDRSAYSGRERPAYERLLADVARGEVDVVVAWHSDRLWRNVVEQQTFLALGRDAGLKHVSTMAQDFDPVDADDSFVSTLLVAVAQKESADKSRRLTRKMREIAEHGGNRGGGRCFGYTVDRKLVPVEAKAIRDAARRVLAGESLGAIARDWNRRGLRTVRGVEWSSDRVRDAIARPSVAGLSVYRGEVVGDADWKPILDRDTHERLVAMIAARKTGPRAAPARKYLLAAGIARCARCGGKLRSGARQDGPPVYLCRAKGSGGCGGVQIRMPLLDGEVVRQLFDYVESSAFAREVQRARKASRAATSDVGKLVDGLSRARARLAEIENGYADGDLDRDAYRRLTERVRSRIEETERRLADIGDDSALLVIDRDRLRVEWPTMELDERRTVLGALVDSVTVTSSGRRAVPARDRVAIVWRSDS